MKVLAVLIAFLIAPTVTLILVGGFLLFIGLAWALLHLGLD